MAASYAVVDAFRVALKRVRFDNREDFLRHVKLATVHDTPYPSADIALAVTFCQTFGLLPASHECEECGGEFTFLVEGSCNRCRLRWHGPCVYGCDSCLRRRVNAITAPIIRERIEPFVNRLYEAACQGDF